MRRRNWLVLVSGAAVLLGFVGTTGAALDQPLAVSPGDGSGTMIAGACPTFSWGAVPGATSYELVAFRTPSGRSVDASAGDLEELWRVMLPGSARSWTPAADQCFEHGGSYAWSVRALVGGEPGAWSEANLFSIEKGPSADEVRTAIAGLRRYLAAQRIQRSGASKAATGSSVGEQTPCQNSLPATARLAGQGNTRIAEGERSFDSGDESVSSQAATPSLGTPSLSVDANISLGFSSNIFKAGRTLLWNDTTGNLALGDSALSWLSGRASRNTAVGTLALAAGAGGGGALYGSYNTGVGYKALFKNTTGDQNTAVGLAALFSNSTGGANTANGTDALFANTSGYFNTATGFKALFHNTTSLANTATGSQALYSNTTGFGNTANGFMSLHESVDGGANTATGYRALRAMTSGNRNTAVGFKALEGNTTGEQNTALGFHAGYNATGGFANIFIDNEGASGDTTTIKIGSQGVQSSTYIAGISGVTIGGDPVLVSSSGRLGVSGASSRRFKKDIEDIGDVSDRLLELRPVSFRYKKSFSNDQRIQYGLVAEEVAKVFPELVVKDKKGRPERVRYELLAPLLLNQLQKQHWTVVEQADRIDKQIGALATMERELAILLRRDARRHQELASLRAKLSKIETQLAAQKNPGGKSTGVGSDSRVGKLRR